MPHETVIATPAQACPNLHEAPRASAHGVGATPPPQRLTTGAGRSRGHVTATGQSVGGQSVGGQSPGGNAAAGWCADAGRADAGPDPRQVLAKALVNAGRGLGLSQETVGAVIGRERTTFSRGLDPTSKAGELALLLIRCYRSLFTLVGGDADNMRHWMHTENRDTGGIPAEQVRSVQGLARVTEYLDAMRGHA